MFCFVNIWEFYRHTFRDQVVLSFFTIPKFLEKDIAQEVSMEKTFESIVPFHIHCAALNNTSQDTLYSESFWQLN